jgi:hypothetical protein
VLGTWHAENDPVGVAPIVKGRIQGHGEDCSAQKLRAQNNLVLSGRDELEKYYCCVSSVEYQKVSNN